MIVEYQYQLTGYYHDLAPEPWFFNRHFAVPFRSAISEKVGNFEARVTTDTLSELGWASDR